MARHITWRNLVERFSELGFDGPYSGGRHLFMIRGTLKVRIPNPHRGDISGQLVSEILRQVGIAAKDWKQRK